MCKNCIHNKYCDFPECINPELFENKIDCICGEQVYYKNGQTIICPKCGKVLGD